MKTCKTCKHWGNQFDEGASRRDCQAFELVGYDKAPQRAELAVMSIDSEGAFLATLGDFGCAMHEDALETVVDNLSDRAVCFASKLRELGVDPEAVYLAHTVVVRKAAK